MECKYSSMPPPSGGLRRLPLMLRYGWVITSSCFILMWVLIHMLDLTWLCWSLLLTKAPGLNCPWMQQICISQHWNFKFPDLFEHGEIPGAIFWLSAGPYNLWSERCIWETGLSSVYLFNKSATGILFQKSDKKYFNISMLMILAYFW